MGEKVGAKAVKAASAWMELEARLEVRLGVRYVEACSTSCSQRSRQAKWVRGWSDGLRFCNSSETVDQRCKPTSLITLSSISSSWLDHGIEAARWFSTAARAEKLMELCLLGEGMAR